VYKSLIFLAHSLYIFCSFLFLPAVFILRIFILVVLCLPLCVCVCVGVRVGECALFREKGSSGQGPLPSLKQIISFLRQRFGLYAPPSFASSTGKNSQLASCIGTRFEPFSRLSAQLPVVRFVFSCLLRLFGLHFSRTFFGEFAQHSVQRIPGTSREDL